MFLRFLSHKKCYKKDRLGDIGLKNTNLFYTIVNGTQKCQAVKVYFNNVKGL